jgi:hypothetical protein
MKESLNRRDFVKISTTAAAAGAVALTGINNACAAIGSNPLNISSKTFLLTVHDDGNFYLLDKVSGTEYSPDPWEEGVGTLSVSKKTEGRRTSQTLELSKADQITRKVIDSAMEIGFLWNQGIELHVRLIVNDDTFTIVVEKLTLPVDTRMERLVYPSRFASLHTGENGYLIVPARGGVIIPAYYYTRIGGEFWRMDDAYQQTNYNGTTQPYFGSIAFNFFGVQKGDSGLTFICDEAFDAQLTIFMNTRGSRYSYKNEKWAVKDQIAGFSSVWDASLGELGYPRKLNIHRHGKSGYVESATIYRKWLDDNGWTRTMAEKIKMNPEREKLIGSTHIDLYGGYPHYAPDAPKAVNFTFDQVASMVDSLKNELKIDKVSISAWGIFENYPPYHWPINKRKGGVKGWKKAVEKAKEAGYLIAGYHSYFPQLEHDPMFNPKMIFQMDPDNPDYVRRVTSLPRWRRTCSSFSPELAKKSIDRGQKEVGENGHFIDILGVSAGMECYDTTNHKHSKPLTRKEDKELRNAAFAYIHDEANLVNWQENGTACDLKYMDCFHGTADKNNVFEETGIPVPLANLVANDLVILTPHPGLNYRHALGQFYQRTLHNILQGNRPIHCIQAWEFEGKKKDILQYHKIVARIQKNVGLAKMVDHQFLPGKSPYDTSTFLIQKTKFDNGTEIFINLGIDPFKNADVELAPYGYEARLANGEIVKGSVVCDLLG